MALGGNPPTAGADDCKEQHKNRGTSAGHDPTLLM